MADLIASTSSITFTDAEIKDLKVRYNEAKAFFAGDKDAAPLALNDWLETEMTLNILHRLVKRVVVDLGIEISKVKEVVTL